MTDFTTQIIDHFHAQKQMHGLTNEGDESFNTKLKSFMATFRGDDDVKFYLFWVTKLYA